jgi:hypothetical protein
MLHQKSHLPQRISRLFAWSVSLAPALLLAHPGHYHPDETDEFDFIRASYLHSHGALDYLIGAILVVSLVSCFCSGRSTVRLASLVTAMGSIAVIAFS